MGSLLDPRGGRERYISICPAQSAREIEPEELQWLLCPGCMVPSVGGKHRQAHSHPQPRPQSRSAHPSLSHHLRPSLALLPTPQELFPPPFFPHAFSLLPASEPMVIIKAIIECLSQVACSVSASCTEPVHPSGPGWSLVSLPILQARGLRSRYLE